MHAQLGNIIFSGLYSFDSMDYEGDEAVYAEFALINGKPRLQKTGDTLQEIVVSLKMHAEFCNPAEQISALKAYKLDGEVLPLLLGNGKYVGDYVIVSMPHTIDQTFDDGSIIQATLSLTLREYVAFNKLEQKALADRRKAFALGNKNPTIVRASQVDRTLLSFSKNITESLNNAKRADGVIKAVELKPSTIMKAATTLKRAVDKGVKAITDVNDQIDKAQELKAKYTGLKAMAENAQNAFKDMETIFPITGIGDLNNIKNKNSTLQNAMRTFNTTAIPVMNDVITRK